MSADLQHTAGLSPWLQAPGHINALARTRTENPRKHQPGIPWQRFPRAILTIIPQEGLCWPLTVRCCGLCAATTCSANAAVSATVAFEEVVFTTILQSERQFREIRKFLSSPCSQIQKTKPQDATWAPFQVRHSFWSSNFINKKYSPFPSDSQWLLAVLNPEQYLTLHLQNQTEEGNYGQQ